MPIYCRSTVWPADCASPSPGSALRPTLAASRASVPASGIFFRLKQWNKCSSRVPPTRRRYEMSESTAVRGPTIDVSQIRCEEDLHLSASALEVLARLLVDTALREIAEGEEVAA